MRADIFPIMGLSLMLTLALETLFALLCGVRAPKALLLVLLVNLLTNPPVVLIATCFPHWAVKLALEISAVLIEFLLYARSDCDIRRPLLFSLGANAFSYLTGLMLNLMI